MSPLSTKPALDLQFRHPTLLCRHLLQPRTDAASGGIGRRPRLRLPGAPDLALALALTWTFALALGFAAAAADFAFAFGLAALFAFAFAFDFALGVDGSGNTVWAGAPPVPYMLSGAPRISSPSMGGVAPSRHPLRQHLEATRQHLTQLHHHHPSPLARSRAWLELWHLLAAVASLASASSFEVAWQQ